KWVPRHQNDWRDRQNEFRRNQDMWATRLPRLIAAAAKTRRPDTAYLFQMGDLIQGDCSDFETHLRFFKDAQAACSKGFGDLPFLTVCGNHDIRGGGDKAFDAYILPIAAKAIGKPVTSANFLFFHGPDAFIFVDFMRPDAAKIDAMLDASEGARHTFFVLHSPIGPYDGWGAYWFLFGKPADAEKRRALFARLLKRRAIVLCGHIHRTQIRRWVRPEGELVEFSANSVWRPQEDTPKVLFDSPARFGEYVKAHPARMNEDHDGCLQKRTVPELLALVEEYRPGLVEYRQTQSAGHYMLRVSGARVEIDFYACDSLAPAETYRLV
ncbi:MAG: metallophosphoesterase, partial [Kiritimatiellae bacterium]|nr:metallophosphoesterase [Kiritimatiellia bacterium]